VHWILPYADILPSDLLQLSMFNNFNILAFCDINVFPQRHYVQLTVALHNDISQVCA